MVSINYDLLILPIMAIFGSIFWAVVFLANYIHFPKMDSRKKIQMSIENATIITVILLFISYLFFIVIINLILR